MRYSCLVQWKSLEDKTRRGKGLNELPIHERPARLKGPSECNKSSTIRHKQAQVLKKSVERVGLGLSDAYVSVWPVERAVKTNSLV